MDRNAGRRGRPYDGKKYPDSASIQLAFRVAPHEVDGCYAELLQKQVEIIEAPRVQEYGHRTLFFKDPEGNILEIYADIRSHRFVGFERVGDTESKSVLFHRSRLQAIGLSEV